MYSGGLPMKYSQHDSLKEARLLLPWYSQGLLDQEQMDWMKIQINTYPQLVEEKLMVQEESDWLQQQIRSVHTEKYCHDSQRLDNLLEKIQQDEKHKFSSTTTVIKTPLYSSYINKIKHYLLPSPEIGLWKAGASLALLVITIQTGFLVQSYFSNTNRDYVTLSGETSLVAQEGNILLVSFKEEATMQQVSTLLTKHQLSFIQGPDLAGLYFIHIPENLDQDVLIKILEAETHIISFIENP
jgi:hypothetical protein